MLPARRPRVPFTCHLCIVMHGHVVNHRPTEKKQKKTFLKHLAETCETSNLKKTNKGLHLNLKRELAEASSLDMTDTLKKKKAATETMFLREREKSLVLFFHLFKTF